MSRWRYPMEETWPQRNDYWLIPLASVLFLFVILPWILGAIHGQ